MKFANSVLRKNAREGIKQEVGDGGNVVAVLVRYTARTKTGWEEKRVSTWDNQRG